MRAIFGVLSLVLALGVVGWLAKTQLGSTRQVVPPLVVLGAEAARAPAANVREQSQQIQQQIKQSVEAAMQQARPLPDDK
jgi:hypothetical protein